MDGHGKKGRLARGLKDRIARMNADFLFSIDSIKNHIVFDAAFLMEDLF